MRFRLDPSSTRPLIYGLFALSVLLLPALAAIAVPNEELVDVSAAKPDDPGALHFRGASFPVKEEAGSVEVVVKRQKGTTGAVSVAYATTDGTAEAGVDYEATDGILEWADGDKSDKSFEVVIFDDEEEEGQETFGVLLSDPTGDAVIGNPSTTTVRIKPSDQPDDDGDSDGDSDSDSDSDSIKLTQATYTAFESAEEGTFTVEREGSVGEVSVEYMTLPGSADEGDDYTATSGVLTWLDGETGEMDVVIPIVNDTDPEALETITVVLTNPTGGATLGKRDSSTVQIVDDDGTDGLCVADDETLCLRDGVYEVTGTWEDFDSNTGPFHMVPASDQSGYAWFFEEENIELLVKILDGCPVNGFEWVFFAATTNVGYEIRVENLETGETKIYNNARGKAAQATTDTTAFACTK